LTALEIIGLLLLVIAGVVLAGNGSAAPAAAPAVGTDSLTNAGTLGMAMVFVLLTYGGWNEAAYISAELKDERRNMVRALIYSVAVITVLYLLVNWAYWRGLGIEGMAKSNAVAADLMRVVFGRTGEMVMALMVAIAALTSMNATMIVGARTNFAAARDWPMFHRFGQWDTVRDTPVNAVWLQSAAALLLIVLGALLGGGFKAMVEFTAPVFWLFFLLSGIALFVLRHKHPVMPNRFNVPLYPLTPAVFCLVCAYMLWSSLSYVYSQELGGLNAAWIGVIVLAGGGMVYAFVQRQSTGAINEST
jgi:basic amino acid/polyamine antiporter, APA family